MAGTLMKNANGKPTFLGIQITARCNLNCPNCIQGRHSSHKDLLPEELERILELDLFDNLEKAAMVGGETLLSPYLPELIHVLRTSGIAVESMATNGTLLDEHLGMLSTAGIPYINISLDAASDEEYQRRRGGRKGLFEKIKANIEELAQACGPETTIALSVLTSRENLQDLSRYVEAFLHWPIHRLTFISIVSWPGASQEERDRLLLFDTPGIRHILEQQMARLSSLAPPFRIDLPDLISDIGDRWCPLPFMNLTMDWEGNVSPCGWKQPDGRFGNIFRDGDNVWENQEMQQWRAGIMTGGRDWGEHCRLCPYRGEQGYSYLPGEKRWIKREKACV